MMSVSPIRVAVIGLGLVSAAHLDGYTALSDCELVAVCDLDPGKTRAVADRLEVRGTLNYQELIEDPAIDALVLLLPHTLHYPIARSALLSRKHVCIEKPLTVTEKEADELIALAAERHLTLALAENTRFVTAYVEAEKLVKQGSIGAIRMIRGFIPDQILSEWEDRSDPTQNWKREPSGCGAIIDCAPHMLYLLIWLLGEVKSLQTISHNWVPTIDLENHAVIAGQMVSGPLFSLEFSSLTEYPRGERVEIYGTEGSLVIDQIVDPPMVLYRGDQDDYGSPVESVQYDLHGWKRKSIMGTASDFISAIANGREPAISAADAKYVVRLVERSYQSVARGGLMVDARR